MLTYVIYVAGVWVDMGSALIYHRIGLYQATLRDFHRVVALKVVPVLIGFCTHFHNISQQ